MQILFLSAFIPNLACAMCQQIADAIENGGAVLFGRGAAYQNVYDIIIHYPPYMEALQYHMQSVRTLPKNAIIIEAGGGTGNMTRRAMEIRPDTKIFMSDFNPAMAELAIAKGIPAEKLSIGPEIGDIQRLHIGGRRAGNNEADLIFSHSVLWNLSEPANFFFEASRVLKKGGILSVSTIRSGTQEISADFVQSIRDGFQDAVASGKIASEQADVFANQNSNAVSNMAKPDSPVKSTLSPEGVRGFAAQYRFEVIDISDCYVVATPVGPKPFFIQFKLRKL